MWRVAAESSVTSHEITLTEDSDPPPQEGFTLRARPAEDWPLREGSALVVAVEGRTLRAGRPWNRAIPAIACFDLLEEVGGP